jgi:hypothetical protein
MIDGMLVEDKFFTDLVAKHLQEYANAAGGQQEMQVTKAPGMPPTVAPEWLMQQLFSMKMELVRVNLQLIVVRYILEGVSATDSANKEDSDIQAIFEMVEKKIDAYMVEFTKATVSKVKKSDIIMPNNGAGRMPPGFGGGR